jgi:hypothetical protein
MRTLLVVLLLLVCGCSKSQLSDDQRRTISHDLRLQIDSTWNKIRYYDYMMGVWQRDRDLGFLEHYSINDTLRVVGHLRTHWSRLIDSLATVEGKKNPDGSFGWPWPSPFEATSTPQPKQPPASPDSARPSRERPPIIGI